jgi:predicted DNA-binding transcriptional regulator YafY
MLNQHKILRVLQLIAYLQESQHKSIQQLSSFLETTERTVYRYLDLLRECGFNLHKDAGQRYFIEKEDADGVHGGSITDGMFTIYFKDIKSGKAN